MKPNEGMQQQQQPLLLPVSDHCHHEGEEVEEEQEEAEESKEGSHQAPPIITPATALPVDDILRLWVGEFGPAQFLHYTLSSLAWTLEALQTMLMIFADKTPSWACTPSSSSSSSAAAASDCTSSLDICSMDSSLWHWVGGKGQSTVSEWNLICGQDYKVGLVQSAFFISALVGAGVFGGVSDSRLGRKGALALVCILNAISGLMTALSPNYWIYFALRAATGFSSGGLGLSSFVLATEPVGPSMRGPVGMSTFYFFSVGIMVLSGLALLTSSWRYLCAISSIPSVLYCLLVLPFLKESPRWYLVQGRKEDAMQVLKSIAKMNGRSVPSDITVGVEHEDVENHQVENYDSRTEHKTSLNALKQASETLLNVFRHPTTRQRMLIMVFVWPSVAVVYYGVSLNVTNVGTNLSLSVFLNALAEVPAFGVTAVLLQKFGRRLVLMMTLLLGGVFCLIGASMPSNHTHNLHDYVDSSHDEHQLSAGPVIHYQQAWMQSLSLNILLGNHRSILQLGCGVVAIFGMAGAYNLLYIYTAELFPTVVRNAALGLASQAAQIGAIIAPLIVVLGKVYPSLPFGLFTAASFVGGLLAIKLPETWNSPLYETFEGIQRAERRQG